MTQSEFDDRMRKMLLDAAGYKPDQAADLRREVEQLYRDRNVHNRRRLLIWSIVYHVVGAAFMVAGIVGVQALNSPADQASGLILFAAGLALLIVIKLWYWIVHTRLVLQHELRELQLQLSRLLPPDEKP